MEKNIFIKLIRTLIIIGTIISLGIIIKLKIYKHLVTLLPLATYSIVVLNKINSKVEEDRFKRCIDHLWYLSTLLVLILGIRLFYVQILDHKKYSKKAQGQANKEKTIEGSRGTIYARGKKMVYDVIEYELIINPKTVVQNDKIISALQEVDKFVELEESTSKKNLLKLSKAKYGSGYKKLSKKVTEEEAVKIKDIFSSRKIRLGSAVELNQKIRREYYGNSLKKTIGRVKETENSKGKKIGISGIEKEYGRYLEGQEVKRNSLFASSEKMVLPISKSQMDVLADGNDVHLTIDPYIQYTLQEELEKQYLEKNAEAALGIIMDPQTGKILAASSYSKEFSSKNPLFQNQYEPGSTFKPLIVASALNDGIVFEEEIFDVGDGKIVKYDHRIKESSRKTRGELTLSQVLERSSNVGMVLIAEKINKFKFEEYLRGYGLNERTEVDYPDELRPNLQPSTNWDGLKKYTMAFGQGIVMTPIQLATAFSSVINGGYLFRPYIVEKVTTKDGEVVRRNLPHIKRRVIKEETSAKMRKILERVVKIGTGKNASIEGYAIGGKTGTAQISKGRSYDDEDYLTSFVGFFPADKPEYLILLMFEKPQSELWYGVSGGMIAAPVFKNIASRIMKYSDMEPIGRFNMEKREYVEKEENYMDLEKMPDLTNKSAREAMKMISYLGLEIKVEGRGKVVRQLPKKGTSIEKINKIEIYLE